MVLNSEDSANTTGTDSPNRASSGPRNAYSATTQQHWECYNKYRPVYPASLFQRIYTYHITNGGTFAGTVHDAGCGPGITAAILALQFQHVICSDFSPTAVAAARLRFADGPDSPSNHRKATNATFTFHVAPAEDMSWITPHSVEMVTMSEALHWTDTNRTLEAAWHTLRPGGTFAAWYYTQPRFPDNKRLDAAFREVQSHWCKLRRSFSEESERTLWVEQSGYDCIAFSPDRWEDVQRTKYNTAGDDSVWIRDADLSHMRFPSCVGPQESVELVEDAQDWQQEVDLDWIRGWFKSLSPEIDPSYLEDKIGKMAELFDSNAKTRAVWPVVLLLACKKD